MALELTYGDAAAGRNYYMLLDGKSFQLNDQPTAGGSADLSAARRKAVEIVKTEVQDLATSIGIQQYVLLASFKQAGVL